MAEAEAEPASAKPAKAPKPASAKAPKPASAKAPKPASAKAPPVIVAPQFDAPDVTGAPGAVFVLGGSLAAIALWSDTLRPIIVSAWTGKKLDVTLPPLQIVGLVLFLGMLVFLSDISGDFAQVALWLVVALWAVYLVMHPDLVSGVVSKLTPQPTSEPAAPHPPDPNAPSAGGGGGHTVM